MKKSLISLNKQKHLENGSIKFSKNSKLFNIKAKKLFLLFLLTLFGCWYIFNTSYNYFKANKKNISQTINTEDFDYLLHVEDLQGVGSSKDISLAAYVAMCSSALNKPMQGSLVILGSLSIGGTIGKVDELSNTLWFFVFSIYGLFLPILGLAIYFRLLLPENIKNKYLVITLIQLFMAHGVNYTKLGIDDD